MGEDRKLHFYFEFSTLSKLVNMPKTICRSIPVQTTLDTSVRFLPANVTLSGGINISQHNLPDYEIQSTLAVTTGQETISLTLINPPASLPVTGLYLDAGTVLMFPGATAVSPKIKVTTAVAVNLLPTAAAVVPTLEIPAPIAINAIAKDKGLLFLPGARSSIVTPTIKTEDVTNYGSGTGMEMVVTGFPQVLLAAPLKRAHSGGAILRISFSAGFTCGSIEAYKEIAKVVGVRVFRRFYLRLH